MKMKNKNKAFSLIELLITSSIIIFIFFSVMSYKIFLSKFLDKNSFINNIKNTVASIYYKSFFSNEIPEISQYLSSTSSSSLLLIYKNINISFQKLYRQTIELNDENNNKKSITISKEECTVSYNYNNKQHSFSFSIPIVFKTINSRSIDTTSFDYAEDSNQNNINDVRNF